MDLFDKQVCRICGCTDDCACPGGCYWVDDDLCSSCVDKLAWIETEWEEPSEIGQKALLLSPSGEIEIGEYGGEGWWTLPRGAVHGARFTHWMQLPQVPKVQ